MKICRHKEISRVVEGVREAVLYRASGRATGRRVGNTGPDSTHRQVYPHTAEPPSATTAARWSFWIVTVTVAPRSCSQPASRSRSKRMQGRADPCHAAPGSDTYQYMPKKTIGAIDAGRGQDNSRAERTSRRCRRREHTCAALIAHCSLPCCDKTTRWRAHPPGALEPATRANNIVVVLLDFTKQPQAADQT